MAPEGSRDLVPHCGPRSKPRQVLPVSSGGESFFLGAEEKVAFGQGLCP